MFSPSILRFLLLSFCLSWSFSSAQTHSLTRVADNYAYPLDVQNMHLANEGGEFLLFEATKAGFFLLGEEPGIPALPDVAWAIYNHAFDMGLRFNHLALEVSPHAALTLEDMGLEAQARIFLSEYIKEHPQEIPQLKTDSEIDFLANVLATAESNEYILWGLDEESPVGIIPILKKLESITYDKATLKLLSGMQKEAEKARKIYFSSGDLSDIYILQLTDNKLEQLKTVFAEDPEAIGWINNISQSRAIYQARIGENPAEAQRLRELLLKRNFRGYYEQALQNQAKAPRVMVKFSWPHLINGNLPGASFKSLGSTLLTYGKNKKMRTFNLLVSGGHTDTLNSADGLNPSLASQAWVKPLVEAAPEGQWTVLNLQAIREQLGRVTDPIDPQLRTLIEEYDAWLILDSRKN